MPFGQHVEKQFPSLPVERDEAEFVEDEQFGAVNAPMEAAKLARVPRLDERADEVGGAPERDVAAQMLDQFQDVARLQGKPARPLKA